MKLIILAAGQGSRLGGGLLPKPLTPLINGKTLLQNQLDTIQRFISLDSVILVIGFGKEMLIEASPDLLYVYNPDFATENTSKSLVRALRKIDDDVIWMNGDVVFHPSVLEKILSCEQTSMIVNRGAVAEEEVKYRTDGKGKIVEVSKEVKEAEGEALGINFVAKKDVRLLCKALEDCKKSDYFEKGLEKCIHHRMEVRSVVINKDLCTEVDFPEDLTQANALYQQWGEI